MTATTSQATDASATTEKITTGGGLELVVKKRVEAAQVGIVLQLQSAQRCVLHWGIRWRQGPEWHALAQDQWPDGTTAGAGGAMQTPFQPHNGHSEIAINYCTSQSPELLEFVLFFPEQGRWDNNNRRNYQIRLPRAGTSAATPGEFLKLQLGNEELAFERTFVAGSGELAAGMVRTPETLRLILATDIPGELWLHWGIARRSPREWLVAPEHWLPAGSELCGSQAVETPFHPRDGFNVLELQIPQGEAPLGISFVLKQGAEGPWVKNERGNFFIPVAPQDTPALADAQAADLADRIIEAEMRSGSWTLMHRYNLCFELLGQAQGHPEALALLFVWLRYSAIRQLTWQRNYNTKPRELAHAQDRLSSRLAELYRDDVSGRLFYRLMLVSIGRGGDGQRIRDEILQIMHRHHLKEVSGHFLEEWHQKLHNNTTPDDVVICEAFLEFLRSNGNRDRFYETLHRNGVTRERLESFERPIRTSPDFVGHLKDALIHDFENFLRILKAVHSSTDLESAIQGARGTIDEGTQGLLWNVWGHRNDPPERAVSQIEEVTEGRRRLAPRLQQAGEIKSLLYLDLGLEQLVRRVVERNLHERLEGDQKARLIALLLENARLSEGDPELHLCERHWRRLLDTPPEPLFTAGWSLHANAVVDRVRRALASWTDHLYRVLQPKAENLGQAFQAEPWTITLFSEEVVRGGSLAFSLSMLVKQMGTLLRKSANLGNWQIVSPGRGAGKLEVVTTLSEIQRRRLTEPTVVLADQVTGEEELPELVVAVIAPDVTDLVSHVAVRARNAGILFAACADPAFLDQLKLKRGHLFKVAATSAGEVLLQEVSAIADDSKPATSKPVLRANPRAGQFTKYAVTQDEFTLQIVGAKSCSQSRLRGKLPDWILQPTSVALPFGCFEKALRAAANAQVAQRYSELAHSVLERVEPDTLVALRQCVEALAAPQELKAALEAVCQKAGLPWPANWESAWQSIKKVWASKWNERAVLSRRHAGLRDEDLQMAVLVQSVVEADYAFVIHTVNPADGNPDELYAEVVLGLGETLVGNFPGRALSFAWEKRNERLRLLSFPAKSAALYGGGLIFRSDSNGEDLAGYAGAGLYDSVLLNPPKQEPADYSTEKLVWDAEFRKGLLSAIARIGLVLEKELGAAQDIEGAVSKSRYYVVQTRPQVGLVKDSFLPE